MKNTGPLQKDCHQLQLFATGLPLLFVNKKIQQNIPIGFGKAKVLLISALPAPAIG